MKHSPIFLLEEALPNVDRNSDWYGTEKSGISSYRLKLGFINGQYFVKSYSNGGPGKVSVTEKNINCGQACP